jgi:hypothetical protein
MSYISKNLNKESSMSEEKDLHYKVKSPYVVIHGQSLCLTRGFDSLRKQKHKIIKRRVHTSFEVLERPMKMVDVEMYYPVLNRYEDMGEYWADVDTGTLYDPFDGKCMSSTWISLILE